ncbi:hemagglutinin [Leclercia adecarboxylata]|nr:hemagglutinin [Leclercia adecarboxylata]
MVATDGDLLVHGSQLDASNDLWLQASQDVNLISALNTSTLDGKNESHGSSAGVGIGYGSGGLGINVSASVNGGRGTERGNGTTHTETMVNAGETLSIVSGRDATLAGAQASGKTVVMDIGRNLTLVSEQDTDRYDSKQQNASAGGSFTFGSMSGSASVNYSRDKMTSDYASVKEQTGIFAGSGGFDITVGDHTQLDGAVIASTAEADRNRLDTGTLGWRDIHNTAEYEVEHQSVGISTGGSIAGQFAGNMASNLLAGADSSGSAEGTTRAAIENGTVVVHDTANQTQDITTLSRDTENANGNIDAIFNKEKEMRRMEEAQLIAEIGMQVADIARTQGEIAKQEAMKDPEALSAAEEKLRAEGKSNPTPQEIADQAGRTAMEQYGTGSDMQRAIQAATAAVQGLAGGDMTAALAGAAAPYVAEVIGHRSGLDDTMEKAAAHAVANAVLAAMQGEDALAGAAGALAGELAAKAIMESMYPGKKAGDLDETQMQTISALAALAAGIAGGVAGDSAASAIAGAQAGKTVVENNDLNPSSFGQGMMGYGLAAQSWNKFAEENGLSIEEKMAGMDKLVNGEKPSWGAEYKVKPYVKGEVAGGAGAGYYFDASIDPNQISANRGETLAVGGRISGQMGIQFGPYLPGIITSERNNSIGLGFGLISGGILYGKDGVGFSIGVGPAWGWSGISTNVANEKIDINGSSGTEFYNYNFGQEKTK